MFDKGFTGELQEAKITIEVGDYRITMEGEMKPPIKKDVYNDKIRLLKDSVFRDIETTVDMSIQHPKNIAVEQWRWTIPIAIPPRIEK